MGHGQTGCVNIRTLSIPIGEPGDTGVAEVEEVLENFGYQQIEGIDLTNINTGQRNIKADLWVPSEELEQGYVFIEYSPINTLFGYAARNFLIVNNPDQQYSENTGLIYGTLETFDIKDCGPVTYIEPRGETVQTEFLYRSF